MRPAAFDDAELYLQNVGLGGLARDTITVSYDGEVLRGGETMRRGFGESKPVVSFPEGVDNACVLMIDPDAPDRDRDSDGREPGAAGPWLHWLVSGVRGGSTAAAPVEGSSDFASVEHVTYKGPTPPRGVHRYIVIVFKQVNGPHKHLQLGDLDRMHWHVAEFVRLNKDVLQPVGFSMFYVDSGKKHFTREEARNLAEIDAWDDSRNLADL